MAQQNLRLQGTTWYFRRRVPGVLRERMGRKEVVRSLRTSDRRTAAERARLAWVRTQRMFGEIMVRPTLTRAETEQIVREWLAEEIWDAEIKRSQGSAFVEPAECGIDDDDDDVAYLIRAIQPEIAEGGERHLRQALINNDIEAVKPLAAALLQQRGKPSAAADVAVLARVMLRAGAEYFAQIGDAAQGKYPPLGSPPTSSSPPAPPPPVVDLPPEPPTAPFSEIYALHEKAMRFPAHGEEPYTEQTIRQNAATVRLWIEFHGDHPLAQYSRDDAEEFKNALQYLPNLHGKSQAWRMTMREAVQKVQALHDAGQTPPPCLSMKTVKRHMSALSTFFDWVLGQKKAYGSRGENIFRQHKYGSVEPDREMWDEEDINVLFRTPIWTGCTPTRRAERGSVIVYDAYYWLPLLAFFHGLRQEEIAQLRASDVRKDDGVWILGIHREDGNHLKNHTAIRSVPIHDQLIELGFLQYVELFRNETNDHLWPTLKRGGPDRKFSHYYRQRFTEYCRDTGIYDRKRPFHALRATFRTFMEETDAKSAHVSKIAGHKLTAVLGEGATYTKRVKASVLKAAIDKFKPDVDLSHLRPFRPGDPIER